ncbi:hypothetical protein D7X33_41005, partial [Butyricicoccus sp. 1XD8-22]
SSKKQRKCLRASISKTKLIQEVKKMSESKRLKDRIQPRTVRNVNEKSIKDRIYSSIGKNICEKSAWRQVSLKEHRKCHLRNR